jgi:hypothetical protein
MVWWRALVAWLLIFGGEVAHGIVRTVLLLPRVGDLPSRQIGVISGSLLILLIAWLTVRWIAAASRGQWLAIGALWTGLMVAAEITLGRALGYTWSRIGEDFDPTRGGALLLGLLVLAAAPLAMARARGLPSARTGRRAA